MIMFNLLQAAFGRRANEPPQPENAFACPSPSLESRLAECLAEIFEAPLLIVADPERSGSEVELRLASFRPRLAERAAILLAEAGR